MESLMTAVNATSPDLVWNDADIFQYLISKPSILLRPYSPRHGFQRSLPQSVEPFLRRRNVFSDFI